MNSKLKTTATILLLLSLSFYLRWHYATNTELFTPFQGDAAEYSSIAMNLATSHTFVQTNRGSDNFHPARPPGYPFFLAAIYSITGTIPSFYWTTVLIQCLIGSATVILTYVLARFALPRIWAFAAALLAALSPHLLSMSTHLLTECLYTFLQLLAIICTIAACRKSSTRLFILAGGVMGLAAFVRPTLALFPLFCLPLFYLCGRNLISVKKLRTAVILFLVASFCFLGGWGAWRHFSVGPDPTGNSQLKTAFLVGTYPNLTYEKLPGMPYREDPEYEKLEKSGYPEILSHTLKSIGREPVRYLGWWFLGKPAMFWSWRVFFSDGVNLYLVYKSCFKTNPIMRADNWLMLKLHPLLVIAAFLTLPFLIKGYFGKIPEPAAVATLLCLLLLGYFTAMFIILDPFPRYALPMGPEMYFLAVLFFRNLTLRRYSGNSFHSDPELVEGSKGN